MSEVNRKEFRKLVEKYLNGTATDRERKAVEGYYALFDAAPEMVELLDEKQQQLLETRMRSEIAARIRRREMPFYRHIYFRAAMIGAMVVGLGWLLRTSLYRADTPVATTTVASERKEAGVNRFLTLPDGSRVILHGDSRLDYTGDFVKGLREVSLVGEAYFDVVHQEGAPFIIHTGKVKTTVLGTAFSIRAWPGQRDIMVSVSRGKVRVDDEDRLIAVLTQDRQVIYNTETAQAGARQVEAAEALTWVQEDMTFDEMPLATLARHLEIRYGIEISLNPEMEGCPITGRFSGTESLEEVLRILAGTSNARYTINGRQVLIDGEKCM